MTGVQTCVFRSDFSELLDEIEAIVYSGTKLNIDYFIEEVVDDETSLCVPMLLHVSVRIIAAITYPPLSLYLMTYPQYPHFLPG